MKVELNESDKRKYQDKDLCQSALKAIKLASDALFFDTFLMPCQMRQAYRDKRDDLIFMFDEAQKLINSYENTPRTNY